MIAFYCRRELSLENDDLSTQVLLPLPAEPRTGAPLFDPARIYLTVPEHFNTLEAGLQGQGQTVLRFADKFWAMLPDMPAELATLLQTMPGGKKAARVCLINGGGGGFGDGILFAPALKILRARLADVFGAEVTLDIFTAFPGRTGAVLRGLGVNIHALPMSLAAYLGYDAAVDFSGMLKEESFQGLHMTDYALEKFGIASASVPGSAKEPFLQISGAAEEDVAGALIEARQQSGGRKMVAVLFTASTMARSMPAEPAGELMRRLRAAGMQPVVILEEGRDAADLFRGREPEGEIIDLSPWAVDFDRFAALLKGMDAIVSVDSAAVHIGAAFRKPTIGIFNCIKPEYRVRYSPTVLPLLIPYSGRECRTPCGISKSRAYIAGTVSGGTSFRMEFDYACDEAVDREKLLQEAMEEIRRCEGRDDLEERLALIRDATARRFAGAYAPCWGRLDMARLVEEVRQQLG